MTMLNCVVVTPEKTVLEEKVDFVALPLFDGEIGIAPGHSPMIGRLGYGQMRLRTGGNTSHYYVDGGFVQVNQNLVTVLTNRAVPADKLDAAVAREALQSALKMPAYTEELMHQRDRAVEQARAQVRVAR